MRMSTVILFLVLTLGIAACGGSGSVVAPPPPPPQPPAPVQLVVFRDPDSNFTTSDIRDVQDQIVRFDMTSNALIWAADGRSFQGYPVSGNFLRADRAFQVRFGTKDGERRAYFTETVATTICDIEIVGGQLVISPTSVKVPGN